MGGKGADESPLMTWGTLGNTPVALTPSLDKRSELNSYAVPGITKREAIAEKLVEKIKSRERNKHNTAIGRAKKSIFGQTPDRLGSVLASNRKALTPAGRRLANQTLSGVRTMGSARSGKSPLVRLTPKKRHVNETPTPGGGGGGMLAAKLNKLNNTAAAGQTPTSG